MTNKSLVDSNILIYAHDDNSPFFQKSYDFFRDNVSQNTICFTLQNYLEAYRIFTQKLAKPLTIDQAWQILDYYNEMDIQVLLPTSQTAKILEKLTKKYRIQGVRVFDAQLVAVMIENGIQTIYTANTKDFACYKEISAQTIF